VLGRGGIAPRNLNPGRPTRRLVAVLSELMLLIYPHGKGAVFKYHSMQMYGGVQAGLHIHAL
jgi:hypothetical protein